MKIQELLFESNLFESRGLAARAPGDQFVSVDGSDDPMEFVSVDFIPNSGSLEGDELMQAIESAEEEHGSITWINNIPKKGGFGLARFRTEDGQEWVYGKFFKEVKLPHESNAWSNKDGIPGYQFASKVAKKEAAGLQPTEVLTSLDNLTAEDIIGQIQNKFGAKSPLTVAAKAINSDVSFPISVPAVEGVDISSFTNYFCEILHPIALQRGLYSGNAGEAAEKFLGESGFENTKISFGGSKTEGLSDSILISEDGLSIKVSSKAGAGASASVKNLSNAIDDIKKAGNHKLLAKLGSTLELLSFIEKGSAKSTPIALAEHFGIINEKEAEQVKKLEKATTSGLETFETVSNHGAGLSKKLQKIFNGRSPKDPNSANPFFHMLTCLAYLVADHVNAKTSFGSDAARILNHSALVQVHTKAKASGDKWVLQGFETKYPGNFDIMVALDPSKAYAATAIKGNITFKILKSGQKPRTYYVDTASTQTTAKKKEPTKNVTAANPSGAKNAPKGKTARAKR